MRVATEQETEVIAAARDLVVLWRNPRIKSLTRAERNEAIETARNNLIAAVENLNAAPRAGGELREREMSVSVCGLCGEHMPAGEEMFKYHGYSGPCPKPPKPKPTDGERAAIAYESYRGGFHGECPAPLWADAPSWVRDVVKVAYLQGKLDGH